MIIEFNSPITDTACKGLKARWTQESQNWQETILKVVTIALSLLLLPLSLAADFVATAVHELHGPKQLEPSAPPYYL
jgi:hypothetical protein